MLVSGVGAVTPFTTPTDACASGFAAGNTWTFIREYLAAKGFDVYTAPAALGDVAVPAETVDDQGPFAQCPEQLGPELTVNAIDDVARGGKQLAAYINYLNQNFGVTEINLVAHSLGGIFTRHAIKDLADEQSPVKVRSLTTIGSPWEPVMLANPPYQVKKACDGGEICMEVLNALVAVPSVKVIVDFFQPEVFDPWTQEQAGYLDDVPVALIAGTYFTKVGGRKDKWPNDAYVQYSAATARSVSETVLPMRSCYAFPDTHSLFVSRMIGEDDSTGLTWDPAVGEVVAFSITSAGTPQQVPNRLGCPAPLQ